MEESLKYEQRIYPSIVTWHLGINSAVFLLTSFSEQVTKKYLRNGQKGGHD